MTRLKLSRQPIYASLWIYVVNGSFHQDSTGLWNWSLQMFYKFPQFAYFYEKGFSWKFQLHSSIHSHFMADQNFTVCPQISSFFLCSILRSPPFQITSPRLATKVITETSTENEHKTWFSGEEKKHEYGMAFIVNKEIVGPVISCTPICSRIILYCISQST